MKHCPKCDRAYTDRTLNFCLEDGEWLLDGSPSADETRTSILHETEPPSEAATKAHIHETDQTAVLPSVKIDLRQNVGRSWKFTILGVCVLGLLVAGLLTFGYLKQAQGRQINSVAVMPFVNESGDPQAEYLTDGMTDTLIRSLSELPNIKVKARTSVFRYKGKEIDPKIIGKELGVQAIVNGRLSQRDGRTNVSLEVVDTENEDVIFSTKYDKPQSELVTLQSDIARDVSGKLKNKFSGNDEARVTKTDTADPEALKLYLKGLFYWHKRGHDNLLQATDYFNKAIEKDSGYALAYSGLSLTYALYPDYNVASPAESYPRSKAAALRALELDKSLAEPHATLGNYYCLWEWDYAKAEQEFRRAIELNPNYATAHLWFSAGTLASLKRFDEAITEAKRAQELDPLSPIITVNLGDMYYYARRPDEAIDIYRSAQELDPTFYVAPQGMGNVHLEKGQYAEAIESHRRAVELSNGDPYARGLLATALARAGQREEALDLVGQIKRQAANEFVRSDALVFPNIALGNKDKAFVWLEKSVDDHVLGAIALGIDPFFDDLRSDPRFKGLLKRMNLPE
jgi:TolB-like protein/Flp pilus assembly protein TadD